MHDILLTRYMANIYRLACRWARYDLDIADDLYQEACIAVWRFNPTRIEGNERAIIMHVARDAMRMWLRSERRRQIAAPPARTRPVRRRRSDASELTVVPIRRCTPRHADAAPVEDQYAA